MLTSLKHYVSDQRDRSQALRRGGQGHIYGTFGYDDLTGNINGYTGRFGCLELLTGQMKWTETSIVKGGVLLVGDHLVAVTMFGAVKLIKPDPAAYQELGSFQAVAGRCWNAPAFSDGRLYVRSRTEAACYDLAPIPEPRLRLSPEVAPTEGIFRLRISNLRTFLQAAHLYAMDNQEWFPRGGTNEMTGHTPLLPHNTFAALLSLVGNKTNMLDCPNLART